MYKHNKQSGFTLVELAIVMLIASVILGASLKFAVPIFEKSRQVEVQQKMRIISEALNAYALRNMRLPCPADPDITPSGGEPFGTERFSGNNGDTTPANCGALANNWSGMIPFRTLGIPESIAKDPWKHIFTYAISPAFALDTSDEDIFVHAACRTRDWYFARDNTSVLHRNARKARFCCPAPISSGNNIYTEDSDLVIRARTNSAIRNVLADPDPRAATGAGSPDECTDCEGFARTTILFTATPNIVVPKDDIATSVAYLILSHGRNGTGALLPTGGRFRDGEGGPDENINGNGDRFYIERLDISDAENDTYDDILLWKTQDVIFAEQGESCAIP